MIKRQHDVKRITTAAASRPICRGRFKDPGPHDGYGHSRGNLGGEEYDGIERMPTGRSYQKSQHQAKDEFGNYGFQGGENGVPHGAQECAVSEQGKIVGQSGDLETRCHITPVRETDAHRSHNGNQPEYRQK